MTLSLAQILSLGRPADEPARWECKRPRVEQPPAVVPQDQLEIVQAFNQEREEEWEERREYEKAKALHEERKALVIAGELAEAAVFEGEEVVLRQLQKHLNHRSRRNRPSGRREEGDGGSSSGSSDASSSCCSSSNNADVDNADRGGDAGEDFDNGVNKRQGERLPRDGARKQHQRAGGSSRSCSTSSSSTPSPSPRRSSSCRFLSEPRPVDAAPLPPRVQPVDGKMFQDGPAAATPMPVKVGDEGMTDVCSSDAAIADDVRQRTAAIGCMGEATPAGNDKG